MCPSNPKAKHEETIMLKFFHLRLLHECTTDLALVLIFIYLFKFLQCCEASWLGRCFKQGLPHLRRLNIVLRAHLFTFLHSKSYLFLRNAAFTYDH